MKKATHYFDERRPKVHNKDPPSPIYTPPSPNIIAYADMKKSHQTSSENQKERDNLEDLELDGTLLKRVLRQYVEIIGWIHLVKDRIQEGRHTNMAINFQFCTWRVISACQHGLCGAD